MKTISLIIFLALLGLGGLFVIFMETSKKDQLKQAEINFLRKRNAEEKDSLETVIKITQDSLEIAFNTIRQASAEREKAHAETQRLIKRYEKIIYVRFANDSARVRAIADLYPTIGHN